MKKIKNYNKISLFHFFVLIRNFGKGNLEFGQFLNFQLSNPKLKFEFWKFDSNFQNSTLVYKFEFWKFNWSNFKFVNVWIDLNFETWHYASLSYHQKRAALLAHLFKMLGRPEQEVDASHAFHWQSVVLDRPYGCFKNHRFFTQRCNLLFRANQGTFWSFKFFWFSEIGKLKKTKFSIIHFLKKIKNYNKISLFHFFVLIRNFGKGNFEFGQFFNFQHSNPKLKFEFWKFDSNFQNSTLVYKFEFWKFNWSNFKFVIVWIDLNFETWHDASLSYHQKRAALLAHLFKMLGRPEQEVDASHAFHWQSVVLDRTYGCFKNHRFFTQRCNFHIDK